MISLLFACFLASLLIGGTALAESELPLSPAPPSIQRPPVPPSTGSFWDKVDLLRQDRQLQQLVEEDLEKSIAIRSQIQTEVDRAFEHTTTLLNVLIGVLTFLPILAAASIWFIRRSVLNQMLTETKKQWQEEVGKQLETEVAEEVRKQAAAFQVEIDTLKAEFKERYEAAIASLDQATQPEMDDPKVWSSRGATLVKLQQFEAAIAAYDKAIQLKPELAEAWFGKGVALAKLQQFEAAIDAYDKAIQLKPDLALAYFFQARCYVALGKFEQALDRLQQAIQLNPEKCRDAAKTDAAFEPLRQTERFKQLVEG